MKKQDQFIKIIRVENHLGEGPYFNKNSSQDRTWKQLWMEGTHTGSSHPEPFDDQGLIPHMDDNFFMDDYICAFKDKNQLNNWFKPSELNKLKNLGFNCVEYEVSPDDVLFGKYQTLLKK